MWVRMSVEAYGLGAQSITYPASRPFNRKTGPESNPPIPPYSVPHQEKAPNVIYRSSCRICADCWLATPRSDIDDCSNTFSRLSSAVSRA